MNQIFILLFLWSIGTFTDPVPASVENRELTELSFKGRGYTLGYMHGSVLQDKIAQILDRWKANTTVILKRDADEVIEEFFEYAQFEEAIKKWTPELYREVEGIAHGSGQSFNDIMVLNLIDEFWVYLNNPNLHHCSSLGVPAKNGNPAYVSQNMDLENFTDGFQTLIQLNPGGDGPRQMILTYPGLIVLNGMNERGIGVCVNTLMPLEANATGLPVAFVIRHLLALTDKQEVLDFIQNVPHASGQNYIIGIRDEVFDFEASANKVVQYVPDHASDFISHTNHPLVNDDYKEWFSKKDKLDLGSKPGKSNSELRLASVEKNLSSGQPIGDALIRKTLQSKDNENHPVCRSNTPKGNGFTFATTIMTLSVPPFLEITAGPPDESEFKRIDFPAK